MPIRCRMDGFRVLKGGSSQATVYFDTKEATKNALDLNESEIEIGQPIIKEDAAPTEIRTAGVVMYELQQARHLEATLIHELANMIPGGPSEEQEQPELAIES